MSNFLFKNYYFWLFICLFIACLFGLFVPLMDEDSAHHADIAMHMYLTGDYVSLVDRGMDYLDKPHLHFWLAALFYQLLGVTTLAYKLPSFLMTVLGTYATYRLGRLLYNKETGRTAALIVASAQAYILANNDVRMDALLTASIIFATWQLVECAMAGRWYNYVLAALGLALGFATKGMVGFVMPCVALFFLLLYQRNWKMMFSARWILVFILSVLFISPVLYCYYLQYDLHPEKTVRGMTGISGVRFILWEQNTERMEGSHWGKKKNNYLFFFHTMLWAFLPWCLLTYHTFYKKTSFFIKQGFRFSASAEFLTPGTIILIFALISSSHYKLPHYLNILFPFFAILTAGWLVNLREDDRAGILKKYLYVQYFVALVCVVIVALINGWLFPVNSVLVIIMALLVVIVMFALLSSHRDHFNRIMIVSVLTMAFSNILLNGNFYPQLLKYQAGVELSEVAGREHIPLQSIYFLDEHSFSFDFYNARLSPVVSFNEIEEMVKKGKKIWVYTGEEGKKKIEDAGLATLGRFSHCDYGITRLKPAFLNPGTRESTLRKNYLIEVCKAGGR